MPLVHRLLLLCVAPAFASPSCLADGRNLSSTVRCACANSSLPRLAFLACDWPFYDGGFKEGTLRGLHRAAANGSACVDQLHTSGFDCSTPSVLDAVSLLSSFSAVFAAGFNLAGPFSAAAAAFPALNFALNDVAFGSDLANLQGILYAEEQAGYLAGFLAGLLTSSGVVGAVLGAELAPVIRFANGFANGARDGCSHLLKACVTIHKYIPNFGDASRGWRVGQLLAQRGADVVFEAGGLTGTCAIAGASQLPGVRAVVGVDVDRYYQRAVCPLGEVDASKIITSAVKRVDQATFVVAGEQLAGAFTAGDRIFAASLGAVDLAPCHDACATPLDCGSAACVAGGGVGTTVGSALAYTMATIYPAFASGDTILANTRVDAVEGRVTQSWGAPNARSEMVAASTAQWAEARGLGVGRAVSGHTAVVCELFNPFGPEIGGRPKVLLFGGQTSAGFSNDLVVFIPDDQIYSFLDSANGTDGLPAPRADHAALLDGNAVMWVFFGNTAAGVAADVWAIDLRTSHNVWQLVDFNSSSLAREGHSACLAADGRALVFGGANARGSILSDLWAFDLQTHAWEQIAASPRPSARRGHTASVIGEKMYIFGGLDAQRGDLNDLWSYAPSSGWEQLRATPPPSLTPRHGHAAVVWDTPHEGSVLAILGGQTGATLDGSLHVYSPDEAAWTKHLSLGEAAHRHTAHAAVQISGRIYVVGGILQKGAEAAARSADLFIHNADVAMEPPSLLAATTNSLQLGWRASDTYAAASAASSCSEGLLPEYQLQLIQSTGEYTTLYAGDQTIFTVEGLSSGESYAFRVRAGSSAGYIGWSAIAVHNTTLLDEASKLSVVRLGILVSANSGRLGALHAVHEINSKSDGVADWLLPHTQLHLAYRDPKCDSAVALQAALELVQSTFDGEGVDAIIGAGCSGASVTAAQVAAGSRVPIVSPSSTSSDLSDARAFPYFLRVIPSDAYSTSAVVDVLLHLWNYSSVALVHSTDSFGAGGADAFLVAAGAADLEVRTSISFRQGAVDFRVQHRALLRSGRRVVVLICQADDASSFLRSAFEFGVGGEGFLWFGLDSIVSESLWLDDAQMASNSTLRELVLTGLFAIDPRAQKDGSDVYQAYLARQQRLRDAGVIGGCSNQTDDDGGAYLWVQDDDGDPSTPLRCAVEGSGRYDTFAYDAVFAVARGLHELVEVRNRTAVDGAELLDVLLEHVRFDGVTGLLSFYAGEYRGDRREGVSYNLLNFVDAARGLVVVGTWQPCSGGGECGWADKWRAASGVGLTYSTSDNSAPRQVGSCRYGEAIAPNGLCACDVGFQLDENEGCAPCPLHTSSAGGDSECDVCAEGRYLSVGAASSTDACAPCPDGAVCRRNTTLATLEVKAGYWRLSPLTSRIYACAPGASGRADNRSTACWGGRESGSASCAPGHQGPLCSVCEGEGVYLEGGWCTQCPDAGAGLAVAAALCASCAVLIAAIYVLHESRGKRLGRYGSQLRRWDRRRKYIEEAIGVVPKLKIAISFAQVISALESTYDIGLPASWFRWTSVIRFWGELNWSDWIVPSQCLLSDAVRVLFFRAMLPLAVVVMLPLLGALHGAAVYSTQMIEASGSIRTTGSAHRRAPPKSRSSAAFAGMLHLLPSALVVAFCFTPSVSASTFGTWRCLPYYYDDEVQYEFLAQDLSIRCDGSDVYKELVRVAWVFVAIWPLGMVAMYAGLLIPCRKMLLAEQMDHPLVLATSFLHRDYKTTYYWWEVVSLVQRTTLTGWLLLIDSEAGFVRLLAALIFSVAFLIILLALQPYKRELDSTMASGTQILYVCIFIGGFIVRLHDDIATDPEGSPDLAKKFLGIGSTEEVVVLMIFVAFAMLGLLVFTLFSESYVRIIQARLDSRWSVCTMDPPFVQWKPERTYACFLSHYKTEAASDARYLHDILRKMLKAPVFLDSSALADLRKLITEGVQESDTILLLGTKSVLSRPWCLLELLEAARQNIPVIVMLIEHQGFTMDGARAFVDHFEREMQKVNPEGLQFLHDRLGEDLHELKNALHRALGAINAEPVVFESNAGDNAMVATMKDVVERMANVTGRSVKWEGRRPFPQTSRHDDGIFNEASYVDGKNRPKFQWLSPMSVATRLSMTSFPEVVNRGSAVFLAVSRKDAVGSARMLRSALQVRLDRACAIGGATDTSRWLAESGCVVVLLTKGLLEDPVALFEIWKAVELRLPLVTVTITGSGYDYSHAAHVYSHLAASLEGVSSNAPKVMQDLLPSGVSVDQAGERLAACLTAIIALAWSPNGSRNHLEGLVGDIVSRVPLRRKGVRAPSNVPRWGNVSIGFRSHKRSPLTQSLRA